MKTLSFLIIMLICTFALSAQNKILFDNTKNEQAGNADWVVDDGNRYPTPAQTGITGNGLPSPTGTAETFWSGSLSSWGVEMAKRGYTIETLPSSGRITYGDATNAQDLSNYKVFVIDEPNNLFSATEKTAIINFVQNGGGLFMISDHNIADRDNDGYDAVAVWNNFFSSYNNPFGITYDLTNISQTSTNVISSASDPVLHGPAGDVGAIQLSNGATITINTSANSSAKAIIFKTGSSTTGTTGVLAAYATYGQGKVFAITDSSIPEDITGNSGTTYDGWGEPTTTAYKGHHGRLVTNATIWLASGSTPPPTTPTLSTSPTSLSGFTYVLGNGPSTNKTFTLSGTNLTSSGNITITSSTNYEVSINGSTYSSSITFAYASGIITGQPKTVYVRLKAGLAVGTYNSENISISGGGATSISVSCNGSVSSGSTTSCGTETFANIPTTTSTSYSDRTWTGDNGGTWTATTARTDQTINGKAICFKGYLQSPTSANGIGDLTVTTKFPFADGTSTLTVQVNGTTVGTIPVSTTAQTTTISGINISGNVQIKILSNGTLRPLIDDFSWTCYSGAPVANLATVTTTSASSITSTGATSGGNVTSDGGASVTQRGVCYGTSSNPTTSNSIVTSGTGTGSFTCNLSGLTAGTTYYVRAYAINSIGTAYGTQNSFTTTTIVTPTAPSATSVAASGITTSGSTLNGTINNNNATSTTVTFEYGTTTSYGSSATASSVTGSTNTSVSASISGLVANTTYHFRVKAVNSVGTTYGNDLTFTTLANTVTYCTSKGSSVTYEWIDYFALGTITNTTAANGGYADFTSMIAPTLALGSSQTVYFSAGFKSSAYTEYFKVYIDYNHNGVFTDAGETVATGSSSSSGTLSATFTVPSGVLTGTTRCRIVMSDNSGTTSCGSYSYGETEDYTVNISTTSTKSDVLETLKSEPLQDISVQYLSLYPIPANEFITVKIATDCDINANVSIINTNGQIIAIQNLSSNNQTIDISKISTGSYLLIYNDGNKKYIKSFIKQ